MHNNTRTTNTHNIWTDRISTQFQCAIISDKVFNSINTLLYVCVCVFVYNGKVSDPMAAAYLCIVAVAGAQQQQQSFAPQLLEV